MAELFIPQGSRIQFYTLKSDASFPVLLLLPLCLNGGGEKKLPTDQMAVQIKAQIIFGLPSLIVGQRLNCVIYLLVRADWPDEMNVRLDIKHF